MTISLTACSPRFVAQVISYDSSRGGVSVITEKGDVTTSYLLIQNADLADSGKYSCSPSNADVASVRVHVLNGKYLHSEHHLPQSCDGTEADSARSADIIQIPARARARSGAEGSGMEGVEYVDGTAGRVINALDVTHRDNKWLVK